MHHQLSTFVETKSTSTVDTVWFSTSPFHRDGCLKSLQRHCYSPWRRPHHSSLSRDLSAAFDCVDSSILLQVLEVQFSITASALNWIASVLTDRTNSVRVGTKASKLYNILFGAPQGSILGSLLFILYTSNITDIASRHGILIHFYADDRYLALRQTLHPRHWKCKNKASPTAFLRSNPGARQCVSNWTPAKPNSYMVHKKDQERQWSCSANWQGLLHPTVRRGARSWSSSRQHTVNDQPHLLGHQILLLPSTTNSPNKTLPQ